MKIAFLILCAALIAGGCGKIGHLADAHASHGHDENQDWAKRQVESSPRHQEWVSIKHGNREVKSFVVYPEVSDKAPAVIVIHEIYGLSDWIMSVADRLAAEGYIAIAPDMLTGMAPGGGRTKDFADSSAIREAVTGLPSDQVTADLDATANYVKALPAANGKIAVAGFCWGGTQSFRFASSRSDLSVAFVFYGTGPTDAKAVERIACPVYGFYGENDARVNATIPETESLMKSASKKFVAKIYDGAGHGFLRAGADPNSNPANKAAHDACWKDWLDLLKSSF